ncbi:ABC transporter substrate-binding protein [Desulfitibacter alkalitolerans]|uniref:ABC transporter substrate-binding protein n=1 Tax=Desulfitibacter alkalitolerans TaxID=264641 RepID=UPI0004884CF4|nr:ABC transporter substrate-binding protein [Desulfitibacter alkalitolerans]
MRRLLLILLTLTIMLVFTGCGQKSEVAEVNPLEQDWDSIVSHSRGTTVNFYMWGGDERINSWVDNYAAQKMKERYNITVNRVPMEAPEFINKLLGEKQVNRQKGSIDLLWINGENFRTARQADMLWGPFAEHIPNFNKYVDKDAPDIAFDFGFPVEGYEVPYGKAQFVFAYDTARVSNPPKSSGELFDWAKANPGRFTYPELPDFTGSVFIRHLMYELCGGYEAFPYVEEVNKEELNQQLQPLWDYLNQIKPYLWRQGRTYPSQIAQLDQLFADGEVDFNMSYHPSKFSGMIELGVLPNTVRTFVWENGTIGNTHFLAIPFNAPNKGGAMVLADFLLSPEAQISKFDPILWGDMIALDIDKLEPGYLQEIEGIDLGIATLSAEELANHRLPEIASAYIEVIEDLWRENVIKE